MNFIKIVRNAHAFADSLNYVGEKRRELIKWYVDKALINKKAVHCQHPVAKGGLTTPMIEAWWKNNGHFNMDLYKEVVRVKSLSI